MEEFSYGPVRAMLTSGNPVATASAVNVLKLIEDRAVLPELYVAAFAPSMPNEVRAAAAARLQYVLGKPTTAIEAAGRLYLIAEGLYKKQPPASVEPVGPTTRQMP